MPIVHCTPAMTANPKKTRDICGIFMADRDAALNMGAAATKPSAPAIHSE